MNPRQDTVVNLDVLALALLSCLLAAVVGVLVLGDPPSRPEPAQVRPDQPASTELPTTQLHLARLPVSPGELRGLVVRLRGQAKQVADVRAGLLVKLARGADQLGRKDLETRIHDTGRKLALLAELTQIGEETSRVEAELKGAVGPPPELGPTGDYHGPYVLIECVEGSAIVYPGRTRISMNADEDRFAALLEQVRDAGFVALAVRPTGWYGNSFDRLRARLYKNLDEAEQKGGRRVGRTTFPLQADEPIDMYLPARRQP